MTITQWLLVALLIAVIAMYNSLASRIASTAAHSDLRTRTLLKRVKRLSKRVKSIPTMIAAVGPRESEGYEQVLGHIHASPEGILLWAEYGSYWKPHHTGHSERSLCCWQVTDREGRILQTVPLDVEKVEAGIQRRIQVERQTSQERLRKWEESEDGIAFAAQQKKELREKDDRRRRNAEEQARREGLWRKGAIERRVSAIVREEAERTGEGERERRQLEEDAAQKKAARIEADAWRKEAQDAAEVAFPVCRLRLTACGYDIVL
jgi:hypothetical protein